MTQSSCMHQHPRGINSNYLYHTKHDPADPTQRHQAHKCARHISFLYNTAFKLLTWPTQQPFLGLISVRKTESQKRSFSGRSNSPLACRGPELGMPTADQNQEHSQRAVTTATTSPPTESLVSLVFFPTSQHPGDSPSKL